MKRKNLDENFEMQFVFAAKAHLLQNLATISHDVVIYEIK